MNTNKSVFSGGTKVTFGENGVYSSGPRQAQANSGSMPNGGPQPFSETAQNSGSTSPYANSNMGAQSVGVQPQGMNQQTSNYNVNNSVKPKKTNTNVKTFWFGFLGAALACILVLGGIALFNGLGKGVTLGSTGSVTIDNADESENLAEAVANKCLPSVVAINVYTTKGSQTQLSSLGSGVILSNDGYVITNQHVIDGASQIKVNAGGQEYDADKIGEDSSSDIAVIKLKNASNLTAIQLANSDEVKVGAWVMSIGSPFGLEQSVATGIVSATARSQVVSSQTDGSTKVYPNLIQTDAAINPGNSGGALVDKNGSLLGINALIESDSGNYSGVGFAIPVNYAVELSKQIIDGKSPSHAQLGIQMTDVTSSNSQQYGWSVDHGAYVTDVVAGGAAEAGGIQKADIIIKVDNDNITTTSDLLLAVRKHNPGDKISITINRNGQEITCEVTLGSDEGQTQQNQQKQNNSNPYNYNDRSGGNGGSDMDDIWRYFFGY